LTTWYPAGVYIPTSTKGDKLAAAKKFVGFIATPAACDVLNKTADAPPPVRTWSGRPVVNAEQPGCHDGRLTPVTPLGVTAHAHPDLDAFP
jgi:hypothetical protein